MGSGIGGGIISRGELWAGIRELARQQGALTVNSAGLATTIANQQKLTRGLIDSLTSTVFSCRRLFRYGEFMLVDQLG